jgi:senataxin
VADGAERQRADGSIYNADEAAVVVALVRELHDEWNLEVRSIRALRVLTFYAAQVGEISRALAAAGLRGVVVGTVDGSQGSEADVILLSCVRSNAGARLGFVSDSLLECMLIANLIRCAARLRHRLALMTTDWLPHQVRGSASSPTGSHDH